MATLYVENIPEALYAALKRRAKENRSSISAEVLALLEENVPTSETLARRKRLLERSLELRSRKPSGKGPFPSSLDLLREDRNR